MASNNPHYEADPRSKVLSYIRTLPDTTNGAKGLIVEPRGLDIVWGNDTRYWRMPENKPAELLQVCWLEVTCSIDIGTLKSARLEKPQIGFKLSLSSDAFGWSGCPIYIMAKIGKKGKYFWKKVDLQAIRGNTQEFDIPEDFCMDIVKDSPASDEKLYFGLYEVWSGKWKGGLQIHHAFLRESN
ncbi:hypothetical protein F0562_004018 [Nyssa sinensis]|uniref:Protein PHLOEM PROTEIN 2-LIKE A9-like n=1 Tax=Nyssa sinensis TaxID=561372 RepID=A0A5J5BXG3_9ASTE|nr:hypothetical protein F0562_004018 [Nyssa sinensis]